MPTTEIPLSATVSRENIDATSQFRFHSIRVNNTGKCKSVELKHKSAATTAFNVENLSSFFFKRDGLTSHEATLQMQTIR